MSNSNKITIGTPSNGSFVNGCYKQIKLIKENSPEIYKQMLMNGISGKDSKTK